MRPQHYSRLKAVAMRWSRRADEADDLVQDALLEAVRQGRDLSRPQDLRWAAGIVRNRARMAARGAGRRYRRETAWQSLSPEARETDEPADTTAILDGLPRSLKAVAVLALSGHNRREIAYLLDLPDTALRQRVSALRRTLKQKGVAMPAGFPGLNLDLAYGQIRDCLLPELIRQGGIFAAHDPDGHLFVVTRSRKT
jgi:RNA polymerase sigma-70 factor (ECF subfamily)